MKPIRKYPRTRHLRGSRFQEGDSDLEAVPMAELEGCNIVVEEKMDGANCGISFDSDGTLWLQSRGHYLTGGPRERQFNRLKQWAAMMQSELLDCLGDRYILYGEWLYAKHTIYYDQLPSYLMEFDILDTASDAFLDTPRRAELLQGLDYHPVRVLYSGPDPGEKELIRMLGESSFRSTEMKT
jgi:ATP-dependent RNA circularization protein (DNA/RNA ligase family)